MGQIVLTGGRVIDPANGRDKVTDLLIEGGTVSKFGEAKNWLVKFGESQVIDCRGMLIVPGLIDMHVHFRTPGFEHKETIGSGSLAALAGGFTTVLAMANTKPVIDNQKEFQKLQSRIEEIDLINLFQVSAITKDLAGLKLVDFSSMANAGAIAFSDDGIGIKNTEILSEALREGSRLKVPVILHCEDTEINNKGAMAKGNVHSRLGVNGIPRETEVNYIYLVIKIAKSLDCPVHIQHVSCAESVKLIRQAKKNGIKITCETAPHYLSLTDYDLLELRANAKMNPPLRSEKDRLALIEGVIDGAIDVIASDHAPHTPEEKSVGLEKAPFGVIGLETEVAVVFHTFYNYFKRGDISYSDLIAKMTIKPAQILGLDTKENGKKGMIEFGYPANITVINPKRRKKVDAGKFQSKSRNCPWDGRTLQGWPVMTIKDGQILMENGKLCI